MKNLAQKASFESAKYAQENNKQAWLALFAEDAIVQDPVGKSPLDPQGTGHKGLDAIATFFDNTIATGKLSMQIEKSIAAGDECANQIMLSNAYTNGQQVHIEMIVVYHANEQGKITSLKAYWDFNDVVKQLAVQ